MKAPEHEQVRVRFDERTGLRTFCNILRTERIAYSLAGNGTVVIDTVDFRQIEDMKPGILKEQSTHVEPVVPVHALSPQARAEAVRHKLMSTSKLLENIRARRAKSS